LVNFGERTYIYVIEISCKGAHAPKMNKFYILFDITIYVGSTLPRRKKEEKWEGFCVKCRKKVVIQGPEVVTLKNGRKAVKGTCPNCGTVVYRFISG